MFSFAALQGHHRPPSPLILSAAWPVHSAAGLNAFVAFRSPVVTLQLRRSVASCVPVARVPHSVPGSIIVPYCPMMSSVTMFAATGQASSTASSPVRFGNAAAIESHAKLVFPRQTTITSFAASVPEGHRGASDGGLIVNADLAAREVYSRTAGVEHL